MDSMENENSLIFVKNMSTVKKTRKCVSCLPKIIKKLLVCTVFLAGGARESPKVGFRRQKWGKRHKNAKFPILAQEMPPSATGQQRDNNGAGKTMVCEVAKMPFSGDPLIEKQKNPFQVAGTKK